jgi:outer membrane murein-binding lipoprotein Lpp
MPTPKPSPLRWSKSTGGDPNCPIIPRERVRRAIAERPNQLGQAHDEKRPDMRRLRFVALAVSTVVLAGCGSGHNGAGANSPASTHAATGQTITGAQELESATQLEADLNALCADTSEGDLLKTVDALQQDYQAVAGSTGNEDDADWQKALNKTQQVLTDVRQVADANASNPDGPNPLDCETTSTTPPAPAAAPQPRGFAFTDLTDALDSVSTVEKNTGYLIAILNAIQPPNTPDGIVQAPKHQFGPYPAIKCGSDGVSKARYQSCSGWVTSGEVVGIEFAPARPKGKPYGIGPIDGCKARWNSRKPNQPPGSGATCSVSETKGAQVKITPYWVWTPNG